MAGNLGKMLKIDAETGDLIKFLLTEVVGNLPSLALSAKAALSVLGQKEPLSEAQRASIRAALDKAHAELQSALKPAGMQ